MQDYKHLTSEQIEIIQDAIQYGIDTVEFDYIKTVWLGKSYKDNGFVIKGFVPDVFKDEGIDKKGAMFNYSFDSYGILWTVHKEEE